MRGKLVVDDSEKSQNAIAIANVGISILSCDIVHFFFLFFLFLSHLMVLFCPRTPRLQNPNDYGKDGIVPSRRVSYSFEMKTHAILLGRGDGLGGSTRRQSASTPWWDCCNVIEMGKAEGGIRSQVQASFTSQKMSRSLLAIRDPMRGRSCGLCGVSSSWRQPRSDGHSHQPRRRRASRQCDYTCGSEESWAE